VLFVGLLRLAYRPGGSESRNETWKNATKRKMQQQAPRSLNRSQTWSQNLPPIGFSPLAKWPWRQ